MGSEPIDLVYCWYSGKVPEGMEACRFTDNGELGWSIRSVDRFAPWVRTIYVFMNDDSLVPEWLPKHPKVRIVRHSEVIPKEVLPLYNSVSIEMWMHLLPGLSERFVYANDDMFLGAPVKPRDFFDRKGRVICRYSVYSDLHAHHEHSYYDQLRYSQQFLGVQFDHLPHHNMDGYLKSVIEDFWKTYPEEARRSGGFRYRVNDQLIRDVFSQYAIRTGRGVVRWCDDHVWLRRLLGMRPYTSFALPLCRANIVRIVRRNRPKFFCLNDDQTASSEHRARVNDELREILHD